MAITTKTLADGQLPSSAAALYTVTSPKVAHIGWLTLVNTSTTDARVVNIYVKRSGGTMRRIIGRDHSLAAKALLDVLGDSTGLKLSPGDAIWGDAAAADEIDYLISGGEE